MESLHLVKNQLKVAQVVNIKLGFTEYLFYNLVILNK